MSQDQGFFQHLKTSINSFLKVHAEFKGVLEGAKLLLSLGLEFSGLMLADISAMERVSKQLRDGNSDRIDEATRYLGDMILRLRGVQRNFLTSPRTLAPLDARVSMIGITSLNRDFDQYRALARGNENTDSLRAQFLTLVAKIEEYEGDDQRMTQERIAQTIAPRPPVARSKKSAKQAERSKRDSDLRDRMKGTTTGGAKKQKVGR